MELKIEEKKLLKLLKIDRVVEAKVLKIAFTAATIVRTINKVLDLA
ncbi:hypothetical protein ACNKUC_002457 [Staphylococcus pseudintermedius]